ncbi:thiol peroxidase [Providencia manganoxydans]|uniref:thiol peroxidase n=1 Tax=Providencia manganoxydans TaxID=2923283 RepID=UPI003F717596
MTLNVYQRVRKILNIFPSIDTDVCASPARQFNHLSHEINNVVTLCISADLPFAQTRFCDKEGLDQVVMLSAFHNPLFVEDYGVAIHSASLHGLMARAVIVLDENNTTGTGNHQ